jgi:hypothetical protein
MQQTQVNSNQSLPSQEDSSSANQKFSNKTSTPGNDLAIAAAFSILGIIFNFFPTYASLAAGWTTQIFQIFGYICYSIGFLGTIVSVTSIFKSKFLEYLLLSVYG